MSGKILLPGHVASVLRKVGGTDPAQKPPSPVETKLAARIAELERGRVEGLQLLAAANELIRKQQERIAAFESCFTVSPIDDGGEALEVDYDRLVVVMYGPAAEIEAVEELPTPPT